MIPWRHVCNIHLIKKCFAGRYKKKTMAGISILGLGILVLLYLKCFADAAAIEQSFNNAQATDNDLWVTSLVYMNISIGGVHSGRITIGLFENVVPKTCLNFKTIIEGNTQAQDGTFLSYKGSAFHRTIKNFMIQGGDFTQRNGRGGLSIWGKYFKDENFIIPHYGPGWIGMANAGPDTNGSQFYITCVLTPWLDAKHTIFGFIVDGMSVVRQIEINPTDSQDRPILEVLIYDCGVLPLSQPFTVPRAPAQG